MNLTEQLRRIAKEASFNFPVEEVIETCFAEARAGNSSRNFTPSDFGLDNSPTHPGEIYNQVKWMDEAVAILREREDLEEEVKTAENAFAVYLSTLYTGG